jgi:coenzyme PQQ precursor peptide PqqA
MPVPNLAGTPASKSLGNVLWPYCVPTAAWLTLCSDVIRWRALQMEWTTPSFEEISLNCEISSYSSAEI